ncbi:MAG: prepilin peptidase [Candidatus Diapherotrites archaeon]|jgi:Flp pilus assembly protein protease CpaA|uniref:Prepilin peptidase n=1 Tax=Candidatus Iainarchaeum sp. TaxID=3101447 RepID=A0A8T5GFS1_9ARCH|nr:prepilin peptidase [Candidatus Diapherotrites archaeon]MBT7240935.1 prepilin peptidase [Candidatus Diapherotrites archaeon]
MITLVQQAALFIGTLVGGATDAKTGYIYDWITYPMIILGIILSLIQLQFFNIASGAIIFVLLFVVYKLGKIGGGDVKMFTGIALLNPFNELNFLITLGFFAAISSMIFYSVFYSIKYARVGIKLEDNKEGLRSAALLGIAIIAYFVVMFQSGLIGSSFVLFVGFPFLLGMLFIGLQEGIKKEFFEKKVPLTKMEEDEVICEHNNKKILKLLKGKSLLGDKEISLLKKNGIRSVVVLRDLPRFGPFIFLGTLFALINPAFFMMLF